MLKAEIMSRFKAGIKRSLYIEGAPGLGKTLIPGQAAKALGVGFKVIHAPLLQPEDYGMPVVSADKRDVDFIVSREKFPLEGADCPDKGIFLIDELAQADASAQKILANLMQAREIHGKRIKEGWTMIATGNRAGDRAGANRLLGHLSDRVTRVTLEASLDDWTAWALANGVKTEVVAFLRFRPSELSNYNPQLDKSPTPRGWVEGVSESLGIASVDNEFEIFKGDVGEGAAAEFTGFLKIFRKLPSPDAILVNPTTAQVPADSPATLYALTGALAGRTTSNNFGRVMQYIARIPVEIQKNGGTGGEEFAALFIRYVLTCQTGGGKNCTCNACQIQTSADFIKWAATDGAKILT
jgi:hypothetical protein